MADGLCMDGVVLSKNNVKDGIVNKNYKNGDIVQFSSDDSVLESTCNDVKRSFYIDSDSGKLCSKFSGGNNCITAATKTTVACFSLPPHQTKADTLSAADNDPISSGTDNDDGGSFISSTIISSSPRNHESGGDPQSPCSTGMDHDDCRKKRCADRYDSSESSDSGVAQLSCTDCSVCSSSSTASSDIADPGSPFSTTSSHSEDSTPGSQTPPCKMPSQQSPSPQWTPSPSDTPSPGKQPWPWDRPNPEQSSSLRTPPNLKRVTATKSATDFSPKRLKTIDFSQKSVQLINNTHIVSQNKTSPPPVTIQKKNAFAIIQNKNLNAKPNIQIKTASALNKSVAQTKPVTAFPASSQNKLQQIINKSSLACLKSPLIPCHTLPKPPSCDSAKSAIVDNNVALSATAPQIPSPLNKVNDKCTVQEAPVKNITMFPKQRAVPSMLDLHSVLKGQQGKITEYFKAQVKPINCVKRELANSNIGKINDSGKSVNNNIISRKNKMELLKSQPAEAVQKYLGLITGCVNQKAFVNGKYPSTAKQLELQRKHEVRTLTLPSQVKNVIADTKTNKKINPVVSLTRKTLAKSAVNSKKTIANQQTSALPSPTVKLTALRIPEEASLENTRNPVKTTESVTVTSALSATLKAKSSIPIPKRNPPLFVPPNLKTGQTTIITPKVNSPMQVIPPSNCANFPALVKLNGTYVPVVKLNSVPPSTALPNSLSASSLLSVETGVPTVPVTKPKTQQLLNGTSFLTECSLKIPAVGLQKQQTSPKSVLLESIQQNSLKTDALQSKDKLDAEINKRETGLRELLQVSVPVSAQPSIDSQKSPILSQPKTIRFPPKQEQLEKDQNRSDARDDGFCRWSNCESQFDTSGALLEHLQVAHVISQATKDNYVCLWVGCKVHGRTSCSRSWLERHVLSHAGNKPFRCIVDGCGCRFNSQLALERHVNSHFNTAEGTPNSSARKSIESGASKLIRRNGKKIRYRRQPWSARMFDFFDAGIMEGLQQQLVDVTTKRTAGRIGQCPGNTTTLKSRVIGRRVEHGGTVKVLVRWYPQNVIPDEWILESEVKPLKDIPIPGLGPSAIDVLHTSLTPSLSPTVGGEQGRSRTKHRRKQQSSAAVCTVAATDTRPSANS